MKARVLPLLLALLLGSHAAVQAKVEKAGTVNVTTLRTEQRVRPLGIESQQPRLSWVIESTAQAVVQTAYHVLVATSPDKLALDEGDLWDSGKVSSDQSIWVKYQGAKLKSNQRCYWKVKVYTTQGESAWSEPAEWGMGILGESHWGGRWIGHDAPFEWDEEVTHSRLSARYLRTEFATDDKAIKRATVHVCGLGLYELFINGQRIGDQVLAPAPTDYRRRVLYNSYDVTEQLQQGQANAIGVTLGNGRYYTMRQNYKPYKITNFGYPKLRLNLFIEYADGTSKRIVSNESWRLTARGPIRSNNEYDGEEYDARLELGDWTTAGYDDSQWEKAQRVSIPYGSLHAAPAEGMKVMRTLPAQTLKQVGDRTIVDFGQNMAGWVRLSLHDCQEGDTIRIRYAETLQEGGEELYVKNFRDAWSTDTYIANGREQGQTWSSCFSYHGFRYVEVTGLKGLTESDITAELVFDEMETTGTWECSNATLNAIVRNAWWGIASNYKGLPVDCPQRNERQPWLGDRPMGSWGESFLLDNGNLYAKWMDDIREAQREDGCIPDVAPAYWNYYSDGMTWPSALPVICDMLYEQYGNLQPIERNYDAIKLWLSHMGEYMNDKGLITKDTYGDWCMPPESLELIHSKDPARQTDGALISTAYYYKLSLMLAKYARLLGHDDDATALEQQAEDTKKAFNDAFLTIKRGTSLAGEPHTLYPDSVFYGNNTATANVLPLAFDLVPDDCREEVAKNLITTIITGNNGHVSCGVIGLQWIMRELTRMGRGDVAYLMATQTSYPSYGYMIEKGATTIWELWNGDTADASMNSGNHVMLLGDLISWLYRDLAGISPAEPGYKAIVMHPDWTIEELSHVSATYRTLYGTVGSAWTKDLTTLEWDLTVPCNTTATVYLPTLDTKAIRQKGISYLRTEGLCTVWSVPSGSWHLAIDLDPSAGEDHEGILVDQFLYEETSFPECHASTIVELANGDLLAAYFGGTKERNPDCCIWVSRKPKGQTQWTAPYLAADGVFSLDDPLCRVAGLSGIDASTTAASAGPVAITFSGDTATARRKACWNPVLFQIPGKKEVLLFYKIGKDVADWTGWLVRSQDGGLTWSAKEPLPEGFIGPVKNKPGYLDGRLICPSSTEGKQGWRIHFEISDDDGQTWRMVGPVDGELSLLTGDRPSGIHATDYVEDAATLEGNAKAKHIYAIQPSILVHKDGRLQVVCRTRNAKLATSWSSDRGDTWSKVTLTDVPNNNSGTDALTTKDGVHVLIYNNFETIPGTPKGVRTPISIATSTDGLTWTHRLTLEDSPISQYSYPSIIEGRDGKLHAIYTWRRQRIKYAKIDLSQALR